MQKVRIAFIAFGKALLWSTLTSFFGLLQLIIVAGSTYLLQKASFSKAEILLNGALLFFSTALVAALTLDYHFSKDRSYPKALTGILFVLYPAVVIIVSIGMYSLCFGKSNTEINMNTLQSGTLAVASMSFVYGILVKTLEFANQSIQRR
jgi:hypothetical protein